MTGWVRVGAWCVCIDQEWHDDISDEEVQGPLVGDVHQIAGCDIVAGATFITIEGWEDASGKPYLYEARAFRPITDAERDARYFSDLLRDSSVPERLLECSL